MPNRMNEASLEAQIVADLTGLPVEKVGIHPALSEAPAPYAGAGYVQGDPDDYDRQRAVDLVQLGAFLEATQPEVASRLSLAEDTPIRRKFLARLQGAIAKKGVIHILRHGMGHGSITNLSLFYGTPSAGNRKAQENYAANIFSITRQLRYSQDGSAHSLDLCLFINGLPFATFELKNRITKQTYHDAIQQYQRDRSPLELLFHFGRCVVHFAVDDQEIWMCTHLQGANSWFLPFNKGWNDGAGNPPNPAGLKTDYLWKEVLARDSLTDILENYAQIVEKKDEKTGKKKFTQIFPRYHQLSVVRQILADVAAFGIGGRYLIQHSAGSGKSNSIAWLSHQLIDMEKDGRKVFDSIIVVTDRRVLDKQIKETIKQYAQVSATVGHANRSGDLRTFIQSGKKIIISTLQKFPFVLDEIGDAHRDRQFAIVIDEAHSSQGGRTAAKMHMALGEHGEEPEEETFEDEINRIIESRKMLPNASYFAFTATPKNKTLEIFGVSVPTGDVVKRRPFHVYTMKQAIQEGFIKDVLTNYTPVESYFRLMKTIEDDPEFDSKRAQKKLRRYVEGHQYAVEQKAHIMVDHFYDHVLARQKLGGQARAMVVTNGVRRAIDYFFAFRKVLAERRSPYQAIVAFSGEREYKGRKVTEAILNDFPAKDIEDKIQADPYRFLIVADKFQTGYDEPLLYAMYVDKTLAGIKAVQTLSRLNRAHPKKDDPFVLDFVNNVEVIEAAFSEYYRTTILSEETDPDKLHDLKADLDGYQIYSAEAVDEFVRRYLGGADRDWLDPLLDVCVAIYVEHLDEDGQVAFKSKAKAFGRAYNFLGAILPYSNPEWEKLATFLNFLTPKLPAPKEDDLSRGILEAIDMESYRAEVQASLNISLADEDAEIEPVPTEAGGFKPEPELERLTQIIQAFNEMWGNVEWKDEDSIVHLISQEIPAKVAADQAYQNAIKNADRQNARIEHDRALQKVLLGLLTDQTELYKLFSDNDSFRKWLADTVFFLTYEGQAGAV